MPTDPAWLRDYLVRNPALRARNPALWAEVGGEDAPRQPAQATTAAEAGAHRERPAITLTLPYPPSSNHLYATGKDGRRHLSSAGRQFTAQVEQLVTAWRWAQVPVAPPYVLGGPLIVRLDVYPPDKKRRDMQNLEKIVCDALEKARVYGNDSQIAELHIYRCAVRIPACVEVTIQERNTKSA